ncbi:coat protein [Fig virus A]|uniref:PCP n=1 Tax=Fig closterovirus 2 TaxID=2809011 RepID=A0A8A0XY56_9CLOS|nr:coat protein [Fig virus A]QSQ86328.1 pCP [Fig closterovirus 2]
MATTPSKDAQDLQQITATTPPPSAPPQSTPPPQNSLIAGAGSTIVNTTELSHLFVSDIRKLDEKKLEMANNHFRSCLTNVFGPIPDKEAAFKAALPAILYFFRIHTTSGEAKHEQTSVNFVLGNVRVTISESDLIEAAKTCPQLRMYSNSIRAWCRSNEKTYIDYSRQNPDLPSSARATRIGLPAHYSWLEADFLTGEHLTDEERAALMIATKVALSRAAVTPEAKIISLTQLGRV